MLGAVGTTAVDVGERSRQEKRGKQSSTCQLSTPSAPTPERRKSRAFIEREGDEVLKGVRGHYHIKICPTLRLSFSLSPLADKYLIKMKEGRRPLYNASVVLYSM